MGNNKSPASEADVRIINNKLVALEGTSRTSREIDIVRDLGGLSSSATFNKDINILIGDGDTVIISGTEGYSAPLTFSGVISKWSLAEVSNLPVSGTISIDILKSDSTIYPTFNSITGLNKPTLNNEYVNSNNSLESWDTILNTGDSIGFRVENTLDCKQIHLIISVEVGF